MIKFQVDEEDRHPFTNNLAEDGIEFHEVKRELFKNQNKKDFTFKLLFRKKETQQLNILPKGSNVSYRDLAITRGASIHPEDH